MDSKTRIKKNNRAILIWDKVEDKFRVCLKQRQRQTREFVWTNSGTKPDFVLGDKVDKNSTLSEGQTKYIIT